MTVNVSTVQQLWQHARHLCGACCVFPQQGGTVAAIVTYAGADRQGTQATLIQTCGW
jgi:hypothetical protein